MIDCVDCGRKFNRFLQPNVKIARNLRVVELRITGLTYREIVDEIAKEFPNDAINNQRCGQIFRRWRHVGAYHEAGHPVLQW